MPLTIASILDIAHHRSTSTGAEANVMANATRGLAAKKGCEPAEVDQSCIVAGRLLNQRWSRLL